MQENMNHAGIHPAIRPEDITPERTAEKAFEVELKNARDINAVSQALEKYMSKTVKQEGNILRVGVLGDKNPVEQFGLVSTIKGIQEADLPEAVRVDCLRRLIEGAAESFGLKDALKKVTQLK